MRLDVLARFLARLEASGRRLGAVRIVADLFGRAAASEFAPIVYLLQGQLRPPYEGIEIGVGERLLVPVLARAYGAGRAAIARR